MEGKKKKISKAAFCSRVSGERGKNAPGGNAGDMWRLRTKKKNGETAPPGGAVVSGRHKKPRTVLSVPSRWRNGGEIGKKAFQHIFSGKPEELRLILGGKLGGGRQIQQS